MRRRDHARPTDRSLTTLACAFGRLRSPSRLALAAALAAALAIALMPRPSHAAETVLDDFDDVSDWNGLTAETNLVQEGSGAGRWADTVSQTSVAKDFTTPLDLSSTTHLGFWLHSAVANGAELQLVLASENPATSGADYYSTELTLDWEGWRFLWLSKDELGAARTPLGWDEIQRVSLSASGWGHTPQADTNLVLDRMVFTEAVVTTVQRDQAWQGSDFVYTYALELTEPDGQPLTVDVACTAPPELPVAVSQPQVSLGANGTDTVTVTITIPPTAQAAGPYETHEVTFIVQPGSGHEQWHELVATPPDAQSAPRSLLTTEDFTRMNGWANDYAWAESRRQRIVDRADGWPADFLGDYGLGQVALPPEGGQWGMHYVCPTHGVNLVYEPPMGHRCPVDDEVFSGWPYDQVIYARQHNDLARAARDAGLAYQLTGQQSYADAAAQILLAYAAAYEGYAIHGTDGNESGSGARVLSQTLDESGWLVQMAWAYDLVYASPALSQADRTQIEQGLLRPCAAIIARHDAGLSNWQAWHNAAIASAGRALGDPRLVAFAVSGHSGFHTHMADSVLSDGFWYESSWGYHFFTLSPMTYLAEMGERGQFPLYADSALQSMVTAPILFAPPDLVLPAFNDSGTVNLRGSAGWRMEAAYAAYGDERLVLPLLGESRDEEALFWGAETLPTTAPSVTESLVFDGSGYAVLRGGTEDDPWYLALDYGPHGGWHGHFDKLGFVFFARGKMLGIDPGSHSYALSLHDTWDRSTLAHNTVVVDETSQAEATGELEQFLPLPDTVWARASAGPAYETATLARDLVMVDGYLLDRMEARATDGQSHQYDWVYHNPGELTHDLNAAVYADFPSEGGYQHLASNEGESTADDGQFVFSFQSDLTYPGGFWASESGVVATSSYSEAQAQVGDWSGELSYDFTAAPEAYVTFRTRSLSELTEEAPTHLAVWVFGDSSGNSYRLRIVDGSGESHVTATASLDFDGWQEVSLDVDDSWSAWGGDENGVIDLPLDNLVFQLNHEASGSLTGAIYLDDWRLTFPTAGEVVVEDYERLVPNELVWIAGQADTTFVVGEGIGPDLTEPVPYVMARRNGQAATFDALHVPHGADGPGISLFSTLAADAPAGDGAAGYQIGGATENGDLFTDVLLLVGSGAAGTDRTFGGTHGTDGIFAWARSDGDGALTRLSLADGSHLSDEARDLYRAPQSLTAVAFAITPPTVEILAADGEIADSRLLAPATDQVTYQGTDVSFTQDGDYVVFGSLTGEGGSSGSGSGAGDDDSGCGCTVVGGSDTAPPLVALLTVVLGALARRGRGATRRTGR